jgi:hypothetical protein
MVQKVILVLSPINESAPTQEDETGPTRGALEKIRGGLAYPVPWIHRPSTRAAIFIARAAHSGRPMRGKHHIICPS